MDLEPHLGIIIVGTIVSVVVFVIGMIVVDWLNDPYAEDILLKRNGE